MVGSLKVKEQQDDSGTVPAINFEMVQEKKSKHMLKYAKHSAELETKCCGRRAQGEMLSLALGGERGELGQSLFPGPKLMDRSWSSQTGGKGT